ncbi:MAG: SLC13 family permease [Firmicutes bacterium]|nr:SLC13 family permease [Bacillota bacterium]MCM1401261.1 SLC13 family permease [Bacteroides sp.]MCM1477190.1 SLC13 family permease [Bacteroides sp.]
MFTIFHGFHLVESYHAWKKEHRNDKNPLGLKLLKVSIAIIIPLFLWLAPSELYGLPGLNPIEQRVLSIFAFAALMWLFDVVSAWTTSLLVVVLLLFCTSDSALWFFQTDSGGEKFGNLVNNTAILHCFADPTIMLFIGGFIVAIAATKSGLDVKLAKVMLAPFGTKSENVLLGFLLVTAVFSMFISNTATAAMMLTFLSPVLKALPADGKGKIGLALAIPIGANIGGIGTPIGTPPNAIALKFLNDPAGMNLGIGFGQWMMVMVPFTIVLLFIAWNVLKHMFPFKQKVIHLQIDCHHEGSWRDALVYVTFAVTVLLWLTDSVTGVNANVVAMLPVGVLCIAGVINRRDLEQISWSILWMIAGAFALGVAMRQSGLAENMIAAIPFSEWSPLVVIIGSGLLCYIMANFISHTATAALFVPILAIAGTSMADSLASYGGVSTLLIGVALCSSLAMVLPISTPPNALADATGFIKQKYMVTTGLIMGVIGLLLGYLLLIFCGANGIL